MTGIFACAKRRAAGKRAAAGTALLRFAAAERELGEYYLYAVDYASLAKEYAVAARLAVLGRRVLYDRRHGGASELALAGVPLEVVAKRGRWKVLASAAHYVQMGIALLATVRLGPRLSRRAYQAIVGWPNFYHHHRPTVQ